ncbi:hypothetical protein BCR43DRAFT_4774 [Syncephalastrum racemosum]|uniref:Uncharacterized protein n=1 Tax=Syncephalastrum racemosum TaxID=13706 RepID=A0A1X2HRV8_SYNRA|nr:hypothetical protein BCR43DRAFT_4774 [Syncephalastrum racemosum]
MPMGPVSYSPFLNQIKQDIIEPWTGESNFDELDSVLYKGFKAKLGPSAPAKASRRFIARRFFSDVKAECSTVEYEKSKKRLTEEYKRDCLELTDKTCQMTKAEVSKYLGRNDRTSRSNSNELNDANNPFTDDSTLDRARFSILKFRAEAAYVSGVHKQDLLYYGIIDLTPSTASKFRYHLSEKCVV